MGFFAAALQRHLGSEIFGALGEAYRPLLEGGSVLLIIWLILLWMYRRRIFLRI